MGATKQRLFDIERDIVLPSIDVMADRIFDEYDHAQIAGYISDGHEWYFTANEHCQKLAEIHGHTVDVVAGVVAALSPRTSWSENIIRAERLIETGQTSGIGLGHATKAAKDILDGALPVDRLQGQKVRAFFDNLANPETSEAITVDTHIWNMIFNDPRAMNRAKLRIKPTEYRLIESVFYVAAKGIGIRPHQLQASTWLSWRSKHSKSEEINAPDPNQLSLEIT